MATYKELQAQIESLQRQAEETRKSETSSAIAEVKAKIREFGLTAADLGLSGSGKAAKPGKSSKAPVAPKFRDPATGITWSGRGKPPKWIAGKDYKKFEI